MYLHEILEKYHVGNIELYNPKITSLKYNIRTWANKYLLEILDSGSRAKGTAVSICSDVDYLISLDNSCCEIQGGLKTCYESLFGYMTKIYGFTFVRKQNVSIRVNIGGLEVDLTPARKQAGYTNDHSLYLSKSDTWIQTNIQKHISDISSSGRTSEIKSLKIWRERNNLDFPSIYLEYLILGILQYKSRDAAELDNNVWFVLNELSKSKENPLFLNVVDPANSNNTLSDLLTKQEKSRIISVAQMTIKRKTWGEVIW